jgi:hypothetical protein
VLVVVSCGVPLVVVLVVASCTHVGGGGCQVLGIDRTAMLFRGAKQKGQHKCNNNQHKSKQPTTQTMLFRFAEQHHQTQHHHLKLQTHNQIQANSHIEDNSDDATRRRELLAVYDLASDSLAHASMLAAAASASFEDTIRS